MIALIDKYWWWFTPLIALGAYLIIMLLGSSQPIWFDEGYSILLAKSSFAELWSLTGVDAHPPLYYVLLKVWGSVFGFGEFALRSFGAVTMGAAVALAVSLIRKLFSTRVALVALPFILFAPFLLRYGYEVRMYALATLIGVGATYALVNAYTSKRAIWWAVYAVLVAAGMYTLYLMVAVWLAHFVWLLIVSIRSKERPFWKWQWWYAFVGAVVLFAAYIPTFLHQLLYSALPGMGSSVTATKLVDIASTLTLYVSEWKLGGWLSILLAATIVALGFLGVSVYKKMKKDDRQWFGLFIALAAIPVIFFAITSLPPRDPIFIIRYMAHVSIFIYMLLGVVIGLAWVYRKSVRKGLLYVATALVVLSFGYGVVQLSKAGNFNIERMQQPLTTDVRDVISCSDDASIIASDAYTYIDSVYYFEGCNLQFYAESNIDYKGGYAMLHDSQQRVGSMSEITSPRIVILGWVGQSEPLTPGSAYHLVNTYVFDKQEVREYQLIAE